MRILGAKYYVSQLTNTIQRQEYSNRSDMESTLHRAWAVNANWNSDGWNVNVNSVANQNTWNAGNQVLSKISSFKDPVYWVFVCLCHPPSILPTSVKG